MKTIVKKISLTLGVMAVIASCFMFAMFPVLTVIVVLALIALFFLVSGIKLISEKNYNNGGLCLSIAGMLLACEGNPLKDTFHLSQLVPDACAFLFLISWIGLILVFLEGIGAFSKVTTH